MHMVVTCYIQFTYRKYVTMIILFDSQTRPCVETMLWSVVVKVQSLSSGINYI